jgi:CubicO group peptidase (beta-lactamase class C family)
MAAPIKKVEPLGMFAGDSLRFDKTFKDYPASEWSLTYRLVAQQGAVVIEFTGTANGTTFEISVPRTTTASWTPGEYRIIGLLIRGTERVGLLVLEDNFTILPDPATSTAMDVTTAKERNLFQLEEIIQDGIARGVESYSYGGVKVGLQNIGKAGENPKRLHVPGSGFPGVFVPAARHAITGLLADRGRLRAAVRAEHNSRGKRIRKAGKKANINSRGFIRLNFGDPLNTRMFNPGATEPVQVPIGYGLPASPGAPRLRAPL